MVDGEAASAPEAPRRCGFIAVVGAPNAGKSTLVNALAGAKVAIVSRKAQTTRMPVRGIAIEAASQLVFVDTPGLFLPRRRLDRAMVEAAWTTAADADAALVVIDAAKVHSGDHGEIVARLARSQASLILVFNKVDLVSDKARLLPAAAGLAERVPFESVFMVSAATGDGVRDLKAYLAKIVPEGPWHYPEDELSDMPLRLAAAEATREKLYERLHHELPYAATVETMAWKTLRDGSVRIEQTVFVQRESQRAIVLGKNGRTIRDLSTAARREIAAMVEAPVHLVLFVKVREGWQDDPEHYREMGLDFPED